MTPNSRLGAELEGKGQIQSAVGVRSPGVELQFRSLQPGFTAVLGQATSVEVQIADGCGNLVGPGGQTAYVAATVSNGDP